MNIMLTRFIIKPSKDFQSADTTVFSFFFVNLGFLVFSEQNPRL